MENRFRHCIREHDQVWDPLAGVPCEKEGTEHIEARLNEAYPKDREEVELTEHMLKRVWPPESPRMKLRAS